MDVGEPLYAGRHARELTFLNDTPLVIQHALHLTASHIHQASLIHKGLPPVEARAVQQHGAHRDQKANVVFPQTCGEIKVHGSQADQEEAQEMTSCCGGRR